METSSSLGLMSNMRIGYSEDIHPIKEGRELHLGGVYFPNHPGLDGHSDADVVLHAVAESILGALAKGDLGDHFPDNDPAFKGKDSAYFVRYAKDLMDKEGYKIGNIDIQIACRSPKLKDYKHEIKENIAGLLDTNSENVSVKAMSYNSIGPIGKGEAIKATSVVLLERK